MKNPYLQYGVTYISVFIPLAYLVPKEAKRVHHISWAGSTGSFEPSNVGASYQTWILNRRSPTKYFSSQYFFIMQRWIFHITPSVVYDLKVIKVPDIWLLEDLVDF